MSPQLIDLSKRADAEAEANRKNTSTLLRYWLNEARAGRVKFITIIGERPVSHHESGGMFYDTAGVTSAYAAIGMLESAKAAVMEESLGDWLDGDRDFESAEQAEEQDAQNDQADED